MVAAVADSLDFEHRYTSGVIAWAPDDHPTGEQIERVLDGFEKTAWAGLEPDRYAWAAVLHRDGVPAGAGRLFECDFSVRDVGPRGPSRHCGVPRSAPGHVDNRAPGTMKSDGLCPRRALTYSFRPAGWPARMAMSVDIYGEEVTPTKGKRTQTRDRYSTEMFLGFFGRDRDPATFSQRDWAGFIQSRRAGRAGRSGEPVGNRTIAWDLTFLMAVLNWAARSRDDQGRPLLDRNRVHGAQEAQGEEPETRGSHATRARGAAGGVPGRSAGSSPSRAYSRTKPGTASVPSASCGGRISTSRAGPSGGGRSTSRTMRIFVSLWGMQGTLSATLSTQRYVNIP